MLRSLERLSDHLAITPQEWESLLNHEISSAPPVWKSVRTTLLRSALLAVHARVRLLIAYSDLWLGAERSGEFHSALCELVRPCARKEIAVASDERDVLIYWLRECLPHQKGIRFLLAWALRLSPVDFQDETLGVVLGNASQRKTGYLFHAWLDVGLSVDAIRIAVVAWCLHFAKEIWFSYVAPTWLKHGGDPTVVAPYIPTWLELYAPAFEAQFVFTAWLDVTKDGALVQSHLARWLELHDQTPEASFVFQAWLEATKDGALVQPHLARWLELHDQTPEANFVFKAWLDATKDTVFVKTHLVRWLNVHARDYDASFVICAWLTAGGNAGDLREPVRRWLATQTSRADTSFVLIEWLTAGGDRAAVASDVDYCLLVKVNPKSCAWLAKLWAP